MANPNPNAIGIPNPNPRPSVQPPPALPSTFKQEYIANPIYSEAAKKGDISTLQVLVDAGDVNAVLTIVSSVLGQGVLSCQHPRAQLHRVPCVGCFIVCTDTTSLHTSHPETQWHQTAIHLSSGEGQTQCIEWLLSQGAYLEVTENEGWTPMMRATMHSQVDAMRLLITYGANCSTRDAIGESVAELARDPVTRAIVETQIEWASV